MITALDMAKNERTIEVRFTVDTILPQVLVYGPIGSEQRDDVIVHVGFDEEMDPEGIVINVSGTSGSINGKGKNYFFEPDLPYSPGETYIVQIAGSDMAGNIAPVKTWQFTITDSLNLSGRVYGKNGIPIEGASIILGRGKITTTDEQGSFSIRAKLSETVLITTRKGYKDSVVDLNLTDLEDRRLPNIYMEVEEKNSDLKIPEFLGDPFTYIVLVLLLTILGLTAYLFRDQIRNLADRIRSKTG